MSQTDPFEPFGELPFEDLVDPNQWRQTSALHTPTLDVALSEHAEALTFTFASGHRETIERRDIEALTRYLMANANVAPLPVDEDLLKSIHLHRVEW